MSLPTFKLWMKRVRDVTPYIALAAVVPGGTVLAAMLWRSRHRNEGDLK